MLSLSLDSLLKLSKTTSPQKLFDYDCVTLYIIMGVLKKPMQLRIVINKNFDKFKELFCLYGFFFTEI